MNAKTPTNPTAEANKIIAFAKTFKSDKYLTRLEYVETICTEFGYHDIDAEFVEFLMDAAEVPYTYIIDAEALCVQLRRFYKKKFQGGSNIDCGIFQSYPPGTANIIQTEIRNGFPIFENFRFGEFVQANKSTCRKHGNSLYYRLPSDIASWRADRCPPFISCTHRILTGNGMSCQICNIVLPILGVSTLIEHQVCMSKTCLQSWKIYDSHQSQSKMLMLEQRISGLEFESELISADTIDIDEQMHEFRAEMSKRIDDLAQLSEDILALERRINVLEQPDNSVADQIQFIEDLIDAEAKGTVNALQAISQRTDVQYRVNSAALSDFGLQMSQLRNRIAVLEEQPNLIHQYQFVKRVEAMPVYDYEAIKKRNYAVHREFSATYRIFARLINIRFNTPIAVAVSATK